MHFVTGGAFNGKRAWVRERYPGALWISAYEGDSLDRFRPEECRRFAVVFEGLEAWVKEILAEKGADETRSFFRGLFGRWRAWEQEDNRRTVVVIGTDILKGIVPVERELRNWRDLTGWVYQDLAGMCRRIDVIWYGISQTIKGEWENENLHADRRQREDEHYRRKSR